MLAKVGFIGIGNMGWPMAACLVKAGYELTVFDADISKANAFASEVGGTSASTPAGASQADFVITMLPSSDVVERVLNDVNGILGGMRSGSLLLEMSSGDPIKTRKLARKISDLGSTLLDAPVSGGIPRAEQGDLAIMVGGDPESVERSRPLLDAMGSSVVYTGPVGSAHAMKALNNLVSAGGFLIGVEAMLIGQRFGLDPSTVVDVLNASTGVNNSTQKKFKQYILSRSFNAGFGLDLMVKDIGIATSLAHSTETPVPFSELCHEMWSKAADMLGRGRDHTEMAKYSEALAATELTAVRVLGDRT